MTDKIVSADLEPRAGLIPYFKDGDKILYLFMVSSQQQFGGLKPMISKGKVEEDESTLEAAFREAEEELGFKISNVAGQSFKVADEHVFLRSANYRLTLYAVEVQSKFDFKMWGDETEYVTWLTLDEFKEQGRRDHIRYIEIAEHHIRMM